MTPRDTRALLWLYCKVSGYGERILRPLVLALVLLIVGTVVNHEFGQSLKQGGQTSAPTSQLSQDQKAKALGWSDAANHAARAMFLLRPAPGGPTTEWATI